MPATVPFPRPLGTLAWQARGRQRAAPRPGHVGVPAQRGHVVRRRRPAAAPVMTRHVAGGEGGDHRPVARLAVGGVGHRHVPGKCSCAYVRGAHAAERATLARYSRM